MKNTIILASILILTATILYAQEANNPSKNEVLKAIEIIKQIHHNDENISNVTLENSSDIKYFKSNFTSKSRNECIASVSVNAGHDYAEWAILMYRTESGKWEYGKWFKIGLDKLDIIDVNNDGLFELITTEGYTGQGETVRSYQLLSIINGKEKMLYQNTDFDKNGAIVGPKNKKDTISSIIEVSYCDENNDKILELKERTSIGMYKSFDEIKGVEQEFSNKTKIYKLVNGRYR